MEYSDFLKFLDRLLNSAHKENTIDAKNKLIEDSIYILKLIEKVEEYKLVYNENEYDKVRIGKRFNILQHKTTKQYWLQSTLRTNSLILPTDNYTEADTNWGLLESNLEID